jgi:hypothetical protein
MIGGTGEKLPAEDRRPARRHVHTPDANADRMQHLIEVIARHGDAVGRDTSVIENTVMIPLAYKADAERQQFMCNLIAACAASRRRRRAQGIMIGDRQECLDTVERYRRASA